MELTLKVTVAEAKELSKFVFGILATIENHKRAGAPEPPAATAETQPKESAPVTDISYD